MSTAFFGVCAALALTGCSTQVLEADIPGPSVHECSGLTELFENFRIQIKKATWSGKGAKTALLNLELDFFNSTPLPHALSNSGDGYVFDIETVLLSAKGASLMPKTNTGTLSAAGIHVPIKPGIPAPAVLTFEAADGAYTLVITRKPTGSAAPGNLRDRTVACKIAG